MSTLLNLVQPAINVLTQKPLLAIVELTLRCNSACRYCDLELNQGHYEMTRDEIKRIFKDLYRQGLRFLLLQGGEPTLRRDLPEIISDLSDMGYHLTLITNGTRLRPQLVEHLDAHKVSLSISLDTLQRGRYAEIRGRDQLNDVMEGLSYLREYKAPKFITCVVSQKNLGEVPAVAQFAKERGFLPIIGAYHWDIARYGKVDEELQYQNKEVIDCFEALLQSGLIPEGYCQHYLRDNIQWLKTKSLPPCDAGRYSISIDCSGKVAPCLALPKTASLLEHSLEELMSQFDKDDIKGCSDASSCNLLCSRAIGSHLKHPMVLFKTLQLGV